MKVTNHEVTMTIQEAMDALYEKDQFIWNQVVDAFHDIAFDEFQEQNGEACFLESGILYEGGSISFRTTL